MKVNKADTNSFQNCLKLESSTTWWTLWKQEEFVNFCLVYYQPKSMELHRIPFFNLLTTDVPIIKKPVSWYAVKINWPVSISREQRSLMVVCRGFSAWDLTSISWSLKGNNVLLVYCWIQFKKILYRFLTHIWLLPFYNPCKPQKIFGFLVFSWGIK